MRPDLLRTYWPDGQPLVLEYATQPDQASRAAMLRRWNTARSKSGGSWRPRHTVATRTADTHATLPPDARAPSDRTREPVLPGASLTLEM